MIQDLLPSICWSLIGFLIGWLVGREMLFISQIREAVVPEDERHKTDHAVANTPEKRSRLIGIVVVVLAVFSVLQGSYYAYETNKQAQESQLVSACQAQFNDDFARVLQQRAVWADEDRKELARTVEAILGGKSPGDSRQALQNYLETVAKNDKLRAENPLPDLNDRDC